MPEITDAELRQLVRYQSLGTPEDLEKQRTKLADFERDNKKQRDEIRELKEKVPQEGFVLIEKTKADLLPAYEELGKPDVLKAIVKERDELKTKDAQRTRIDLLTQAVKAMGASEDVVPTVARLLPEDASVEVRTERVTNDQGEEEEIAVPYVTLPGEGQQAQRFADLPNVMPEFKGVRLVEEKVTEEAPNRTPTFPRQKESGAPAKGNKATDPVEARIQRMQERAAGANPLRLAKNTQ